LTRVSILFDNIYPSHKERYCRVMYMVLNASFNNISVISWWSVLLVEETTDLSLVTDKLDLILLYWVHL